MAWFNRTLGVILTADTKQMERGLDRAERRLATFGKSRSAAQGGLGAALLTGKGTAALAGGGALVVGLSKALNAAKESEVVLGQTRVAVDALGLSYSQNADLIISKSDEISRASAFDDEAVLQSFQKLVRGTKDVGVALDRAALAANVARGNYKDLEWGTNLVVKAQMGQIGALRRAGIQIGKNATATEALALLQENYGGAAVEYADYAAGASDRLAVAWENLAEQAGELATGPVADLTGGLAGVLEKLNDLSGKQFKFDVLATFKLGKGGNIDLGSGSSIGAKAADLVTWVGPLGLGKAFWKALLDDGFNPDFGAPGGTGLTGAPGAPRGGGGAVSSSAAAKNNPNWKPILKAEQNLLLARQRAEGTVMLKDDLKAAQDLARFYEKQAGSAKDAKSRFAATQALISAQNEITDIQRQMADRAKAEADADKRRVQDAARKALKARKDLADRLAESAESFKDALLTALDRKQDNLDTSRAVFDAKQALQQAQVLGGPESIRLAKRDLQDAMLGRQRYMVEGGQVTANKNGTFNFNGATLHFHGIKDVKAFLAELRKMGGQTAQATTGLGPGTPGFRPF